MSILERIPKYTLNNYNQLRVKAPEVYIDDIFDPLFNKKAKEYLDAKYGWGPIGNTFAGYAEGINNALVGQNDKWGILGPGMGILSGFGRSMDKADDFLIGGLTEGVNLISQGLGNDVVAENPLKNIFVNDEDYTGTRLLAAMGNTMSKMAGAPTLDESDFKGLWNVTGMGLDLATDPGILGGSLAKRFSPDAGKALKEMPSIDIIRNIGNSQQSPLASVGQLLSNYDDLMANISWDLTAPGLRQSLSAFQKHISQIISASKESRFKDTILKQSQVPDSEFYTSTGSGTGTQWSTDPNIKMAEQMLDDVYEKYAPMYAQDFELMQEWASLKNSIVSNDFERMSKKQVLQPTIQTLDNQSKRLSEGFKKDLDTLTKDIYEGYSKAFSDTVDDTGKITSTAPVLNNASQLGDTESLYDFIARNANYSEDLIKSEIAEGLPEEVYTALDDLGLNLNYDTTLDELKGVLEYLESGDFADYASDNAILQNALNKYKGSANKFTSSPVRVHSEPIYTHSNPKLIRGLQTDLKRTLIDIFESEDFNIHTYEALNEKIIKDLQNKGLYTYLKHNNLPGLESLLKTSKKGITDIKYNDYLNNVQDFVKIIETIEKGPLSYDPFYEKLINFKNDIKTKYLLPMDFKTVEGVDYSPVTGLQSILNANPYAFYSKNAAGEMEFDFNKFNHFASNLPYLEVRVDDAVKVPYSKIFKKSSSLGDIQYIFTETTEKTVKEMFSKNVDPKTSFKDYPQLKSIIGKYSDYSNEYRLYGHVKNMVKTNVQKYLSTHPNATFTEVLNYAHFTTDEYMSKFVTEGIPGDILRKFTDKLPPRITDEQKLFKFRNNEFKNYLESLNKTYLTGKNISNTVEHDFVTLNSKNPAVIFDNIRQVPNYYTEGVYKNIFEELFTDTSKNLMQYELFNNITPAKFKNWIPVFSDNPKRDLRLFDLIQGMSISKRVNESSDITNKATLNTERGKNVLSHAKKLKEKYKPEQISEYLTLKDTVNGDIVKGSDYLSNLKTSRGLSITILKNSDESIKTIENAILNNNAVINTGTKHGDLVDLVKYNVDKNGKISSKGEYTVIGYKLNTKNVKALKDLNNLKIDDSRLKDVVFQTADTAKAADLAKYSELEEFFKESQGYSEDLSKLLGFTSFEENYYKHALSDNVEGGKFLKNVYTKLDMDNLDTLATLLGKNDKSLRGTFGNLPMTRTLRGGINRYNGLAPVFSTDLEAITSSALAKGVFDDSNFQSFVDLFINDNFKIKRWASNVDDLKRVMYLKDETGKFTGNLDNMQLVAPKFNESGRLVGFTKFDKLSDKGLEKALKNENTVLMPTEMIATLDHLTKKDAKLSNKMYNFMNKTFMLPFKLGTLVNPGFLVGNMNDAYLKQATALAQKHGTSVSEELTNVAVSIKNVIALNNQMSDIYTKYVEWCALNKKHIPDNWKNYTILTESKKAKNNFIEWLNMDENLTGVGNNVRKKAQLWMYINNFQETSVYKGKVRKNTQELEDITESTNNIIYENDKNIIERAFTGSGKYNPKDLTTWGLFTSNPVSNAILKSSAQIETIMRSSAVLNDLTHKYNSKDIMDILEGSESLEKSFRDRIKNGIEEEMRTVEDINRQQLEIDAMDALNLSSAANFNYEDTSGLIDTLSYGVPFPTFFLKNLAFWTNIIVENPQYIDNAISIQQGLWGSEDTSEDEFAAEAKGRGAIPVEFGGQKLSKFFKGIFKPSPLNSMFGAFNLINDPVENMRYRLNPAIQLATSPLLPDEEVRYRPHNDNIYQRNINKGDEEFNPLSYMFHTLNPYERQVKTFVRTPKKMEKGEAQLSDFLPSVFQPKF